jgi:DNA-binding CsgD family transcriptional regulator
MFADRQVSADASLRWGWLAVVPSYALWDEESAYAVYVSQLQSLRDAGALARLALELPQFILLAVRCGDLGGAEATAAEAEAVADAAGTAGRSVVRLPLAVFRGQSAEAQALIESTRTEATALGQGQVVELTEWLSGVLCNGFGHYQETVTAVQDLARDGPEQPFVSVASVWTAVELLEAATRTDNADVARIALDRVIAGTSFARTDSALGILARCQALLSDRAVADGLYRESIERLGRTRLRPELARAHLLYGEWLRRERQRIAAREQLHAAYDLFTAIGMEAFAERARIELLATGEKVRKRTVETQDELTAQERQVTRLAREGLSNAEIGTRLFISPRTVEWHLRKAYAKLGVRSRRELSQTTRRPEPVS